MIDDTDIRGLAEYLVRTRGSDAREFVAGRIESSDRAEEWERVAEAMDRLPGINHPVAAKAPGRA
jgi:hypothetical protein